MGADHEHATHQRSHPSKAHVDRTGRSGRRGLEAGPRVKPGPSRVIEAQLRVWGAELDRLVAEAEKAGAATTVDLRERIHALRARSSVAQAKLDGLRAAGDEKWDTFRAGVESAWSELEVALAKVMT